MHEAIPCGENNIRIIDQENIQLNPNMTMRIWHSIGA